MIDADGSALGIYRKSHIPDGPGYTEKYYFNPGDTGFRVWPTRYGVVGVGICWDQWFPETARVHGADGRRRPALPDRDRQRATRPGLGLQRSLAAGDAGPRRRQPDPARRRRTGSATRPAETTEITFYGSSFIADATGAKVAEAGRDDEAVLVATFDLDAGTP